MPNDNATKTCFVVMGFGEKTDFQTQRTLDLDKSYRLIIKKAVEAAGLRCVRADDVVHSGLIDEPMYQQLLSADVVVADLSTSNANAIYELGVRHALRPHTTIVIAEKQFKFPFDLKSLLIRSYEHLGKGIDGEEADRACAELTAALKELVANEKRDSPVYTFLPSLNPPTLKMLEAMATQAEQTLAKATSRSDLTLSALMESAKAARNASDFVTARAMFLKLRERQPSDPYVIQQLALVTYKSKLPDQAQSLKAAGEILKDLDPRTSSDPETLGLWGAIHKRLWELEGDRALLDESIWAYERGFYLRNDYYTGINYAYLLNVRASVSERSDAIADYVMANRIRQRVARASEAALSKGIYDDDGQVDKEATFWATATLLEAHANTDDEAKRAELVERARQQNPADWMLDSMSEQMAKLGKLLDAQRALVQF